MKARCAVCGAEFDKKRNQKTCSAECSKTMSSAYTRNYMRKYYEDHKQTLNAIKRARYASMKGIKR